LTAHPAASRAGAPAILLHSQDPANLYGPAGAPLGWGGLPESPSFGRRSGNWLVLRGGHPILVVEQHGKRLTALPTAGRDDLAAATACLPDLLKTGHGVNLRGKLTVEEWNGQPVTTSAGKELLEAAGFVRDYQALTLYGAWR
jgi:ATP-dependent Lhr-like helicase